MSVQPAGAWMVEVVPLATMFAIITSPLTTPAGAGFSARRWATPTALELMVTVFWPVAPMLSWIASNIAPWAAPLAEPLDTLPFLSHSSVIPAGMLATDVPKAGSVPSAAPKEATSMVFATAVVMLGVERDVTLLVYPVPFCTSIGVLVLTL